MRMAERPRPPTQRTLRRPRPGRSCVGAWTNFPPHHRTKSDRTNLRVGWSEGKFLAHSASYFCLALQGPARWDSTLCNCHFSNIIEEGSRKLFFVKLMSLWGEMKEGKKENVYTSSALFPSSKKLKSRRCYLFARAAAGISRYGAWGTSDRTNIFFCVVEVEPSHYHFTFTRTIAYLSQFGHGLIGHCRDPEKPLAAPPAAADGEGWTTTPWFAFRKITPVIFHLVEKRFNPMWLAMLEREESL